jgi:hypothetical protein
MWGSEEGKLVEITLFLNLDCFHSDWVRLIGGSTKNMVQWLSGTRVLHWRTCCRSVQRPGCLGTGNDAVKNGRCEMATKSGKSSCGQSSGDSAKQQGLLGQATDHLGQPLRLRLRLRHCSSSSLARGLRDLTRRGRGGGWLGGLLGSGGLRRWLCLRLGFGLVLGCFPSFFSTFLIWANLAPPGDVQRELTVDVVLH